MLLHGRSASAADLQAALNTLQHRGPDASGHWSSGCCSLGHRRLSILDLSAAGNQPMSNEDGALWLTFNGEIYNFRELRRELQAAGHQFSSDSDSEVILHGYEEWGIDCLRRLRGMFAFAICDKAENRVVLARDGLGKKPLYYQIDQESLFFASEIAALLQIPGVCRDISLHEIDQYLCWGYVPAPGTGFETIRKLQPGSWMVVEQGTGSLVWQSGAFWSPPQLHPRPATSGDPAVELRRLLEDAVRLRLESDVEIGCFLSGGIDSTIITGLMARLTGRRIRTFSIGFAESSFNELQFARAAARLHNTDHTEWIVSPDAAGLAPEMARHYGEPFADDSALPTWNLCRETARHVKVALSGDGGDEVFGGYERYRAMQLAENLRRIPLAGAGVRALSALPLPGKARRFARLAVLPAPVQYARWISQTAGGFSPAERRCLYRDSRPVDEAGEISWMESLFQGSGSDHPSEQAMWADLRSYLAYDLLPKVDIASMAHGLEVRSPMLDLHVLEWATGLPLAEKIRGSCLKRILRRACADLLPPEVRGRGKMGFGMPVGAWLRGALAPFLEETLFERDGFAARYFHLPVLRTWVAEHRAARQDRGQQLWTLLMLQLWYREVACRLPASGQAVRAAA